MKILKLIIIYCLYPINQLSIIFSSLSHHLLFAISWGIKPKPVFFDHSIDLYYQWRNSKNPLWLERGIFNSIALNDNSVVLELCCGDGFNAKFFYSIKSNKIIACDNNPQALNIAKLKNNAKNIKYVFCDILKELPDGKFDNIIWDFGFRWDEYLYDIQVNDLTLKNNV
jgi:SAM-dependent methyltransferase